MEKERQLQQEKAHAERELAMSTLYINENKKILKTLSEELGEINKGNTNFEKISEIEKTLKNSFKTDKDWDKMILHFEKVNPDFFTKLKNINPKLTVTELKHCAYIKIKLNTKETAQILGIEPSSVKTTRYRLKKKLNLSQDDDLAGFISSL